MESCLSQFTCETPLKVYFKKLKEIVDFLKPVAIECSDETCLRYESVLNRKLTTIFVREGGRAIISGLLDCDERERKEFSKEHHLNLSNFLLVLLELGVLSDFEYTILLKYLVFGWSVTAIAGFLFETEIRVKEVLQGIPANMEAFGNHP